MNNIKNKARLSMLTVVGLCFALLSTQTYALEKKVFYHNNLLGSPVAATDESGNLCWREDYRPYGEKIRNEDQGCGLDDNVTGFTGHVHDRDIGLTYMQARYYDPIVGRFMGVDPVGYQTGRPMSYNRYVYAYNNPYRYVDPLGMEPGGPLPDGHNTYGPYWGSNDHGNADPNNYAVYKNWEGVYTGYYTRHLSSFTYMTEDMPEYRALVSFILGSRLGYGRPTVRTPSPKGVPKSADKLGDFAHNYQRSAGAAQRVPQVLQSGGNKLSNRTSNGLNEYFGENLTKRDWGRALEGLKRDNGLRNDHHGRILDNGDYVNDAGDVIGNISHYLP